MDVFDIPEDVWIEVFESIDDPALLACLMRTCQHFYRLAMKPLLRTLHWVQVQSTSRNFTAWRTVYTEYTSLVRKITMSIPFDFPDHGWHTMTPDKTLYDDFHSLLPTFDSLHELALENTTICPHTYNILAQLPSLRALTVRNCKYHVYDRSFLEYQTYVTTGHSVNAPTFSFDQLNITHLSVHKITMPQDNEYHTLHPLMLASVPSLVSLSTTWNTNQSMLYNTHGWHLPHLTFLDVTMPHLTRELIDSLVTFVNRCPLSPKVALCIERHSLSDQQINSIHLPLRGVWSYKGPLPIASFTSTKKIPSISRDNPNATLTHLVMNEPMDLVSLLDGLEVLPKRLETLEIQVRKWDVELLFAIRWLFPKIKSLVIRYGKGTLAPNFLETLGSNILFDLPNLTTFKIIYDEACMVTTRQLAGFHHNYLFGAPLLGGGPPHHHPAQVAFNMEDDDTDGEAPSAEALSNIPPGVEYGELKDYLTGWNRYCKSLRCFQLQETSWWERRFDGDKWVEKVAPPVAPRQPPSVLMDDL